jgi:hypothetical protein
MMEALRFSETSVLTKATWHDIPDDGILYSYGRENLKSYKYIFYIQVYYGEHCGTDYVVTDLVARAVQVARRQNM